MTYMVCAYLYDFNILQYTNQDMQSFSLLYYSETSLYHCLLYQRFAYSMMDPN